MSDPCPGDRGLTTSGTEFPTRHAADDPDRVAVLDATTGRELTYGALEDRSRALAHQLREWGLRTGDHLALVMRNRVEFFEICWAAQRIGLYFTAVNHHLSAAEMAAVVDDCGARVLVLDDYGRDALDDVDLPNVQRRVVLDGGGQDYECIVARATGPLDDESEGEKMLYTSGTTGRPKGVARPLTGGPPGSVFLIRPLMQAMGFDRDSVMISPAPLYHSAPLGYSMGVHRLGGQVVITARFDPFDCLQLMRRHDVTHGLFVPTMFNRMLRLPGHEHLTPTTLRAAVHGAAPCPPGIKEAMIDWWGPVLHEYYAGTEGAGMTVIDSNEWLAHRGSVGRPVAGAVHVVDRATGTELAAGETGTVYFSGGTRFRFHGDDVKTDAAYGPHGWTTMGDIGHLDDEGYLYLTDREAFTVISGGVNLYPQEVENVLATHPLVADVAAFGVPHEDLGEQLVAVVQPVDGACTDDAAAAEILAWCAERLSAQKLPRRLGFRTNLPRGENGKLYKGVLQQEFRP